MLLEQSQSWKIQRMIYFLVKCQEFVTNKLEMAVNDGRHDPVDEEGQAVTHLPMAISARDLHEQVVAECEEGVTIPSVQ